MSHPASPWQPTHDDTTHLTVPARVLRKQRRLRNQLRLEAVPEDVMDGWL
jgi:hypothetical protein